ncbi:MAG: ABC transporter permease [Actinobacteria bacterium]|nr:MAG: ABC transporter permease [Actinomycetota bacterium]TML45922.1 MAG: ABC transporter permease [Actinomycetota bacterium]
MATQEGGGSRAVSLLGRFGGLVPAALYFGLFFFVPFGLIVCFSFWQDFDYKVVHHWTLDNYRYFFSVPDYVGTMWATLWVALAATAITLGLAFPFAYWLSRYVPRGLQKLLLVLVVVPFWTSYLLRVYSWLNILGDKGVINSSLTWLGVIDQPLSLLYHRWTVVVVLVYLYFPFGALTLYSSIDRFDWDQLHAAMDLGASPIRAIRKILIPQIRPGIAAAVIFVFIPILGEYLAPQIVGGTDGVMMGNLIDEFQKEALYARAASISLLIAAFIVLLLVLFRKSLSAREAYGA